MCRVARLLRVRLRTVCRFFCTRGITLQQRVFGLLCAAPRLLQVRLRLDSSDCEPTPERDDYEQEKRAGEGDVTAPKMSEHPRQSLSVVGIWRIL
ncbi:hypothetical protein A6B34_27100 [Mycolicibacterium monacense]|nr:hypothetical protein A6B34_27100 [Mycolicibacterium monacense]